MSRKFISSFLTFSLAGLTFSSNVGIAVAEAQSFSSSKSCDGKLGVHRTIKVSNKNTTLVGVGNHGRIGLRPKELVLTFDDGPREGTTAKILKTLADECVKATFFALGRSARAHPDLLRRVAKEGHTIATHSQSHPLLTKRNDDGVRAEIRRGVNSAKAALEGTDYEVSNFFRYPFLDRSKRTDAIVREMGLVAFHMNIDSWDWRPQTPQEMVQLTLSRTRAEGSGIILFHDIQDKTAAALPDFLRAIKNEGYKIVHIVPGDNDFNYREDLIARQIQSHDQTTAAVSSTKKTVKTKKSEQKIKKIVQVPHPQSHPLGGALRKTIRPITQRGHVRSLNVAEAPEFRSTTQQLQPAEKQQKKRFGFFRKIFSRKSVEPERFP